MIRRSKLSLTLWAVITAALLAFIWGNSLMPEDASSELSGWFGELICKILPIFSPENPTGSYLLRKCAHFCEFAALGAVLCWGWAMLLQKQVFLYSLACGILVAAIDETIQLFVPGRYGCIQDVALDSSGVLTGAACVLLLILITRKNRKTP